MKLFVALLALTLSLAGCGPVDGDPIHSGAAVSDSAPRPDAVTVAQLRQQAEQNGSLAAVLYLGSVPERTADVDAALDACRNSRGSLLRTSRQTTGSQRRAAGGSCTASLLCAGRIRFLSTKSRTPSTRTRRAGNCIAGGMASPFCCCATAPRTPPTPRRWSTAPPAARWTGRPGFLPGPAARSRWRA